MVCSLLMIALVFTRLDYIHICHHHHTQPPLSLCLPYTSVYALFKHTVYLHILLQLLSCGSLSLSLSPAVWHLPSASPYRPPCLQLDLDYAVNQSRLTYAVTWDTLMLHFPIFVFRTNPEQKLSCEISGLSSENSAQMPLSRCCVLYTLHSARHSFPISVLDHARTFVCVSATGVKSAFDKLVASLGLPTLTVTTIQQGRTTLSALAQKTPALLRYPKMFWTS